MWRGAHVKSSSIWFNYSWFGCGDVGFTTVVEEMSLHKEARLAMVVGS